ncbi:MAG TPA: hypothetical protein VFN35_27435 [Ktedonobacteraceae bacterium]|nr:hypothetical protein [Ktedonobacteraceae bacterium]
MWSPDGTTFLTYAAKTDGTLTTSSLQIVNGSGQVQKTIVLKTGGPEGIAPSGGGWLSNRINLSANKSDSWGPAWSPDGSTFSAVYLSLFLASSHLEF